ncbi:MAG: redoxin family protein [Planctomycetota bacterium]
MGPNAGLAVRLIGMGVAVAAGAAGLGCEPASPTAAAGSTGSANSMATPADSMDALAEQRTEGTDEGQIEPRAEDGVFRVGDAAPSISWVAWPQGEPRARLSDGRVTVVDFWATWCGPCVQTMPHLSDLADAKADAGVDVIGVSIDTGPNSVSLVERFLEDRSEQVRFEVLVADGGMRDRWFEAAGLSAIPTTMVIDGDGRLVWVGHPMATDRDGTPTLERVVDEVVSGRFDLASVLEAAQRERAAEAASMANAAEIESMQAQLGEAWASGDNGRVYELIDGIVALDPDQGVDLAIRKAEILLYEQGDAAGVIGYVRGLADGAYSDDHATLMTLASLLSGSADPGEEGRSLAIELAQRVVAWHDGTDPSSLVVLAEAHFAAGETEEAIASVDAALGMVDRASPAWTAYDLLRARYEAAEQEAEASNEGGLGGSEGG